MLVNWNTITQIVDRRYIECYYIYLIGPMNDPNEAQVPGLHCPSTTELLFVLVTVHAFEKQN